MLSNFDVFLSSSCDRLYFFLQKNIVENLVKIQKDGTVEVDVAQGVPVASELLELDTIGSASADVATNASDFSRSIPKLSIVMLVVGTRGDVQPFVAFARRLQACLTMIQKLLLFCLHARSFIIVLLVAHLSINNMIVSKKHFTGLEFLTEENISEESLS